MLFIDFIISDLFTFFPPHLVVTLYLKLFVSAVTLADQTPTFHLWSDSCRLYTVRLFWLVVFDVG